MKEVRDAIAHKLEATTVADLVERAEALRATKDAESDFVI
jgi:DNA-binding IscR family transcriptional regulator